MTVRKRWAVLTIANRDSEPSSVVGVFDTLENAYQSVKTVATQQAAYGGGAALFELRGVYRATVTVERETETLEDAAAAPEGDSLFDPKPPIVGSANQVEGPQHDGTWR